MSKSYLYYKISNDSGEVLNHNEKYLDMLSMKMNKNYIKRYDNIITMILSNSKRGYKVKKKYNIKCKYMYEQIAKYIDENNINVNYTYFFSDSEVTKKLDSIDGICPCCSHGMRYYHEYKRLEYIEIEYFYEQNN